MLDEAKNKKGCIYVCSIPTVRKENEIKKALDKGLFVLAEKPAFSSYNNARNFIDQLKFPANLVYG